MMYKAEYEWALANPDDEDAKCLLSLASIYAKFQEHATLGLIEGCVHRIRIKMRKAGA